MKKKQFKKKTGFGLSTKLSQIGKKNCPLAKKNIGYNPSTSLQSGLKETWDWYLKNEKEYLGVLDLVNK